MMSDKTFISTQDQNYDLDWWDIIAMYGCVFVEWKWILEMKLSHFEIWASGGWQN